jgi:hypothetical protein
MFESEISKSIIFVDLTVDLAFLQCNQPLNKVLKSREPRIQDYEVNLVAPYCACARGFRIARCKNSANRCIGGLLKAIKMGVVFTKGAWLQIFCARFARTILTTPPF